MKYWRLRTYYNGAPQSGDDFFSCDYDTARLAAISKVLDGALDNRLACIETLAEAKGEVSIESDGLKWEIMPFNLESGLYVEITTQATGSSRIVWFGGSYIAGKQVIGSLFSAMFNGDDWKPPHTNQNGYIDFDTMYDSRAIESFSDEEISELSDGLESYSRFSMGGLHIALETAQ